MFSQWDKKYKIITNQKPAVGIPFWTKSHRANDDFVSFEHNYINKLKLKISGELLDSILKRARKKGTMEGWKRQSFLVIQYSVYSQED